MTAEAAAPVSMLEHGKRAESAIATNVRVYLGLSGKTQKALGEALGITKSAMSMKMVGKVGWSVCDLVTTADFLGVTPAALMDDTILSKAESGYAPAPARVGALVGAGSPRYFVSPYNPDGTLDTNKLGAVLGASATQAGQNGPEGMEESEDMTTVIMRTSHDDGPSGTLGSMTTVIMRTTHENVRVVLPRLFPDTPETRFFASLPAPVTRILQNAMLNNVMSRTAVSMPSDR